MWDTTSSKGTKDLDAQEQSAVAWRITTSKLKVARSSGALYTDVK